MSQERYEDSQLYRIRHSAAHIMAEAMLERFPEAKLAIGPPIEDGFTTISNYPVQSMKKT